MAEKICLVGDELDYHKVADIKKLDGNEPQYEIGFRWVGTCVRCGDRIWAKDRSEYTGHEA